MDEVVKKDNAVDNRGGGSIGFCCYPGGEGDLRRGKLGLGGVKGG